jgi:hypothetical protein
MPRSQQRSNVYGYTVECDKCHGKKFLDVGVACPKCDGVGELYVPELERRVDWFSVGVILALVLFAIGVFIAIWFTKYK